MVDFSKYQTPTKKDPEEKITPGEKDQKSAHTQPEKKSIQHKKNSKIKVQESDSDRKSGHAHLDPQVIDQKLNELDIRIEKKFNEFNERLLNLLNIGVIHEFTQENVLKYIRVHKGTKEGQLSEYFYPIGGRKVQKMVKYLHSTGVIKKDKNNFYITK